MTIRKDEAEEVPGKKPEGEGETELSADEDVEVLGGIEETDQSIDYIILFTKAVKFYQKKKGTVLVVRVLNTSYETAQRTLADMPGKCI